MVKNADTQAEKVTNEAQKAVGDSVEKLTRGMEDATQFGQENLEAVVASSRIAAKAAETISAELAAYSKKSYEDGLAAAKELTSSKSVTEYIEKQAAYNKTAFDGFVAEATKMNEIATGAAREVFEPLGQRFGAALEAMRNSRA